MSTEKKPAGFLPRQRWLAAFNRDEQTSIPGFAALQVIGVDAAGLFTVDRVEAQSQDVVFNGPNPIPPQGYGTVTRDFPTVALYDGTAPHVRDTLGWDSSSYKLAATGSGFVCVGDGANGTVMVRPAGAADAPTEIDYCSYRHDGIVSHGELVPTDPDFIGGMQTIGGVKLFTANGVDPRASWVTTFSPIPVPGTWIQIGTDNGYFTKGIYLNEPTPGVLGVQVVCPLQRATGFSNGGIFFGGDTHTGGVACSWRATNSDGNIYGTGAILIVPGAGVSPDPMTIGSQLLIFRTNFGAGQYFHTMQFRQNFNGTSPSEAVCLALIGSAGTCIRINGQNGQSENVQVTTPTGTKTLHFVGGVYMGSS